MLLQWTEPEAYGTSITSYEVEFLTFDGVTMAADETYCASESTLSCFIPMNRLTDPSKAFKLTLNTFIQARVRALNYLGAGDWSEINTDQSYPEVAFVMTVPASPTETPYRNPDLSVLSASQISVIMPEVEDDSDAAGGTAITSYQLEWRQPSDTENTTGAREIEQWMLSTMD